MLYKLFPMYGRLKSLQTAGCLQPTTGLPVWSSCEQPSPRDISAGSCAGKAVLAAVPRCPTLLLPKTLQSCPTTQPMTCRCKSEEFPCFEEKLRKLKPFLLLGHWILSQASISEEKMLMLTHTSKYIFTTFFSKCSQ